MSDDYQIINIRGLDEETRQQIVTNEVNSIIGDAVCPICQTGFINQDERDQSIYVGKIDGRMRAAHDFCYVTKQIERQEIAAIEKSGPDYFKRLNRAKDDFAKRIADYAKRDQLAAPPGGDETPDQNIS